MEASLTDEQKQAAHDPSIAAALSSEYERGFHDGVAAAESRLAQARKEAALLCLEMAEGADYNPQLFAREFIARLLGEEVDHEEDVSAYFDRIRERIK